MRDLCGASRRQSERVPKQYERVSIELVPLATGRVGLRPVEWITDTPYGLRGIGEISSFDLEGERLRAHMFGVAAADWPVVSPGGMVVTIDVRLTLQTDDAVLLYAHYSGRIDLTKSPVVVYSAPCFDAGDERYKWLSRIQVVGKGSFDEGLSSIDYEFFELR